MDEKTLMAMKKVADELSSMPREEFLKMLDEHQPSDLYSFIKEHLESSEELENHWKYKYVLGEKYFKKLRCEEITEKEAFNSSLKNALGVDDEGYLISLGRGKTWEREHKYAPISGYDAYIEYGIDAIEEAIEKTISFKSLRDRK